LLLVGLPDRSIARNNIRSRPPGFIPPLPVEPPMLTAVIRSKVGVWPPNCALLERSQYNVEPLNQPPTKRLPFVATSSVPYTGPLGILIGACQVTPPSVERWNCTPPPLQLKPSSAWYWKPCPGPLVLSMVNHSLSPPPAPLSGERSTQVWPPFVERHRSSQKNDWFTSDWRLR